MGHDSTYSLVCPISGYDEVSANVAQRNLFDGEYDVLYKLPKPIAKGTWVTASAKTTSLPQVYYYDVDGNYIDYYTLNVVDPNDSERKYRTFRMSQYESQADVYYVKFTTANCSEMQLEIAQSESADSLPTAYEPVTTYTADLPQTVYGGTVDLVSGVVTVNYININPTSVYGVYLHSGSGLYYVLVNNNIDSKSDNDGFLASNIFVKSSSVAIGNCYITASGMYLIAVLADQTITTRAQANNWFANNNVQFVYELATPRAIQLTPQEIQTLVGTNNVWSEDGDVEITYNIPITNLLVKRQDVADVSGSWLTLYSQPVTQASDMDFTFIDFLNQYGKTYKYALVPLLTQTQSGVEVEVEGGYTVSDEVQSIFDGVYIGDSTGVQRLKAGVAYNNLNTNQQVGVIPTLGNKYPIIVSNSNIQYDTGSVSGLIVPDDFYSNGNLSRLDMSDKREVINDFLTNKKPKILKDWNGNIWLVVFTDNVDVSFDNNYGMGVATFISGWTEVGAPTNQEDLQRTGLINVGGD